MTACTLCGGFGGHHDPIAHGNEPEEREEREIRDGLMAIGCPPDVAEHIASMDRREDETRERLLRLTEITGPIEIRKIP